MDVENEQILMKIPMSDDHAASELPRGFLLKIVVAKAKSTNTVRVVIRINHAIHDAFPINAWEKDVEALMFGDKSLERIPNKVFAEVYYVHQISQAARMAADHHCKRLHGIGSTRHAIWPPFRS